MEQLAIAITGCVAIWLANDQRQPWRKWASVFGLVGQPFWFYSAFIAEQWGILALSFVYTAAWVRGLAAFITEDVVEKTKRPYMDMAGNKCTVSEMMKAEPEWAMSRVLLAQEYEDLIFKINRTMGPDWVQRMANCLPDIG